MEAEARQAHPNAIGVNQRDCLPIRPVIPWSAVPGGTGELVLFFVFGSSTERWNALSVVHRKTL